MFSRLRRRIILITMAIATIILVLAGSGIMLFSSAIRPEPKFHSEPLTTGIRDYIDMDRKEGNDRLLVVLFCTGIIIDVFVFLTVCYFSKQIVEPVKNSYDKQKVFIANASHELKTPLAVIQANVEALDIDKDNKRWKDNIESEILHANELVLGLLQLAKMDAGNINETPAEKVDLNSEIKKRIEIFSPKFSGKIIFKNSTKAKTYSLPKQDVIQILDILLDNATKYGEKKILVTLEKNCITVSNDGVAVPESETKKIFDRFYQTDKTKEGSGLGLAIAKSLCEQNGWDISCKSIDRATEFSVVFS